MRTAPAAAVFFLLSVIAMAAEQPAGSVKVGAFTFALPDGWKSVTPSSAMRKAQLEITQGPDKAEVTFFQFGASQGGTAQANIDRWISQMQQPDGSSSKDKAKTETMTVNGLKVTTVDVIGTYTAEMAPGSGTFHNDENYRLRAAVVETPKGNYFVKLAGPAKTIAKWDQSYTDYLKSFEFK
jgi:hypothetical protein